MTSEWNLRQKDIEKWAFFLVIASAAVPGFCGYLFFLHVSCIRVCRLYKIGCVCLIFQDQYNSYP